MKVGHDTSTVTYPPPSLLPRSFTYANTLYSPSFPNNSLGGGADRPVATSLPLHVTSHFTATESLAPDVSVFVNTSGPLSCALGETYAFPFTRTDVTKALETRRSTGASFLWGFTLAFPFMSSSLKSGLVCTILLASPTEQGGLTITCCPEVTNETVPPNVHIP